MKRTIIPIIMLSSLALYAGVALGQDLIIFPAKGQSNEQMERDKYDCYQWAKQQTAFDPMQQPQATEPPPKQEAKQGGVARGAARGAAVGAVVGEIAKDDPGKGAASGAAASALIGGMRRRDQIRQQQQAEQQWAQEQAAAYEAKRNKYNRAYSACLEGKGYTVK